MPARPSRIRTDANAGRGPAEGERAPLSAPTPVTSESTPTPSPIPAPIPAPTPASGPVKPRKFTALLDADTDARYGRLLDAVRADLGPVATRQDGNGRTRAGYDVSRADLLRALLLVAEDPSVMQHVRDQVQSHYTTPS